MADETHPKHSSAYPEEPPSPRAHPPGEHADESSKQGKAPGDYANRPGSSRPGKGPGSNTSPRDKHAEGEEPAPQREASQDDFEGASERRLPR